MPHDSEIKLAEAICGLTCELREARHERQRDRDLATRRDLRHTERRIIAAVRGGTDADLEKVTAELAKLEGALGTSTDALAEAVKANQPPPA